MRERARFKWHRGSVKGPTPGGATRGEARGFRRCIGVGRILVGATDGSWCTMVEDMGSGPMGCPEMGI